MGCIVRRMIIYAQETQPPLVGSTVGFEVEKAQRDGGIYNTTGIPPLQPTIGGPPTSPEAVHPTHSRSPESK